MIWRGMKGMFRAFGILQEDEDAVVFKTGRKGVVALVRLGNVVVVGDEFAGVDDIAMGGTDAKTGTSADRSG